MLYDKDSTHSLVTREPSLRKMYIILFIKV